MVIKRTEEVVEMANGNRAHCYQDYATLDELKKAADDALDEYEKDPSQQNQLAALYATAEYTYAADQREDEVLSVVFYRMVRALAS